MNNTLFRQKLLFFTFVGIIIFLLIFAIVMSLKPTTTITNQQNTSGNNSLTKSSISTQEQIPERIDDFYSSLPFSSQYFMVEYDKKASEVIVTSSIYERSDLEKAFKTWIKRFPNFESNKVKVRYITKSDLFAPRL